MRKIAISSWIFLVYGIIFCANPNLIVRHIGQGFLMAGFTVQLVVTINLAIRIIVRAMTSLAVDAPSLVAVRFTRAAPGTLLTVAAVVAIALAVTDRSYSTIVYAFVIILYDVGLGRAWLDRIASFIASSKRDKR